MARRFLFAALFAALLLACPQAWAADAVADLRAGYAAVRLGDAGTALKCLNRALESDDLNRFNRVMAYALRGDAYRMQRRFGRAAKEYNRAIKAASRSTPPIQMAVLYISRGSMYKRKGKYDRAIKDFTKALQYYPKSADAYYHRGSAWRLKRKFKKAVADYTRALRLGPNHKYYYHRSQALARMGRLKEAVKDMAAAVRLRPESRQYRSRLSYLKSLRDR
jgi:tetratricopeptide (TPR) repeat protein